VLLTAIHRLPYLTLLSARNNAEFSSHDSRLLKVGISQRFISAPRSSTAVGLQCLCVCVRMRNSSEISFVVDICYRGSQWLFILTLST